MAPCQNQGSSSMSKKIKALYLFISSLVIGLFHLSFAFAKSTTGNKLFYHPPASNNLPSDSLLLSPGNRSVYDSLQLQIRGLSRDAFAYAKQGFDRLLEEGRLLNDSIISIIDFSKPSSEKRLFILDMKNYRVIHQTLVSHGRNSGKEMATQFSNQHSTYMSSPGFYITRETYEGKNGYSLKLQGLEPGINDNAYERGIVVHGAPYVTESYVQSQGYIGRSQGCPAVPAPQAHAIINQIRNGSCLFIYHPSYISRSVIL